VRGDAGIVAVVALDAHARVHRSFAMSGEASRETTMRLRISGTRFAQKASFGW